MSPIVYSLTLADTVVSSARQAVSKSPVSKVIHPALRVLLPAALARFERLVRAIAKVASMRIITFVSMQAESLNEQWVWPTEGETIRDGVTRQMLCSAHSALVA